MGWRFNQYCEDLGLDPRKAQQYVGLFSALVVIYGISISSYLKFITTGPAIVDFSDLMRPLIKFCLLSAVPFAVVAYRDQNWTSSDAAPVCVFAWAAVCAVFGTKYCIRCTSAFTLPFVPFVLSALLSHTVAHTIAILFSHRSQ
ncbi:MAG: hypothetical protein WCF48_05395 [Terriglobales bacterium]